MKARCQYTGLVISDDKGLLPAVFTQTVHPLFHASESKLMNLANLMTSGDRLEGYSDNELRLVTLACLHSLNNPKRNPIFIQTKTIDKMRSQDRGSCRLILYYYPIVLSMLSMHSPEWIEENMPAFNINAAALHDDNGLIFAFAHSWFHCMIEANSEYRESRNNQSEQENKMARYASSNTRIASLKSTMLNGTFETKTKAICTYLKLFAELPEDKIVDPFSGNTTTIKDYWLTIIKADDFILVGIPENDISELEDHLIDNLPVDEFSSYVMEFLRELKQRVSTNKLPFAIADFLANKEDESNYGVLEAGTKPARKQQSIDELLAKAVADKQAKQVTTALHIAPGFSLNNFFANNKDINNDKE